MSLDGVLADTATGHIEAWTHVFADFLPRWTAAHPGTHADFTAADYHRIFAGRTSHDGVTAFLAAHGIALPAGSPLDGSADTISGLVHREQRWLTDHVGSGVPPHQTAVALVRHLIRAGLRVAVYSPNTACAPVLRAAGLETLVPVCVDAGTGPGFSHDECGAGLLLAAAERLGAAPERTVVLDGSAPGVGAARAGGFALIIGVDRSADDDELRRAGADVVAADAADLRLRDEVPRPPQPPDALDAPGDLLSALHGRDPFVCLDFDGALCDEVADPAHAELVTGATEALEALAAQCPVAILSSRDLDDLRHRVGLAGIWYAGSGGFEIADPDGSVRQHDSAAQAVPLLQAAVEALDRDLHGIAGVRVQPGRFGVAVHYRDVAPARAHDVVVAAHAAAQRSGLRATAGHWVVDLRPDLDWGRADALAFLMNSATPPDSNIAVYAGEAVTDEDVFDRLRLTGITVAVRHGERHTRSTAAHFVVASPAQLCALLRALTRALDTARTSDPGWSFTYEGYDPPTERLREALCTVGNGYLATRGAAPEARADALHYPGTYAAGVYNRLDDMLDGRQIAHESLVNLPNWLPLTFRIDGGAWFDVDAVTLLDYRQSLDLRSAVLTRKLRFRDRAGRTTSLTQNRFVAMHTAHIAALETIIAAEDWSGTLEIRSTIDGDVRNAGVARYRQLADAHLSRPVVRPISGDAVSMTLQTTQSRITVALAARTTVWRDGEPAPATYRLLEDEYSIGHHIVTALDAGQRISVEKVVSVVTSRDTAITAPAEAAERHLSRQGRIAILREAHQLRWSHLWQRMTIDFDDHLDELRVLRLHILHLLQTVSYLNDDLDAGVPARGLHGEAYRGHVFWDELFVFAVLNLRLPTVTRSLLRYRYRRLPEARRAAALAGYRGAMFPWQSGSDGREESPQVHLNPRSGRWNPDPSRRAHHVGIAVAYNVWQFYQVTGDLAYLIDYGAELLVEIARFWVSRTAYDPRRDRYLITGVIGPDEFHSGYPGRPYEGVDNNAYTNVMAAWVILRAQEALRLLPLPNRLDLNERLGLSDAELADWDRVSRRLYVPFHDGRISQFDGYDDLEELDWQRYRDRYGSIDRLDRILEAEGDDVNRYKVSKQADVLMLLYLLSSEELGEVLDRLGYRLEPQRIPDMVDYYLARTSHGSTLSAVVNTWVLARAHRDRAWEFFRQVLDSDITDIQGGTTAEGIHLAAMAGSVDLVQRCFTGLEMRADRLVLSPYWPEPLGPLSIAIKYRGHHLRIRVSGRGAEVSAAPRDVPAVTLECRGRVVSLSAGRTVRFRYRPERR
ncbi:trehalose-phosphatase [Mycobacterium sp. GA-2829]|uniref:trehalose-phosphatase n=1 Tax=Mycobacterium sp. GA-2829 TaxID=1772283 RepID=UPI0009E9C60A|nr:trehalose-phosphatase [Mycobacterium sp. GA-2829]